jgi:hypothetical protein
MNSLRVRVLEWTLTVRPILVSAHYIADEKVQKCGMRVVGMRDAMVDGRQVARPPESLWMSGKVSQDVSEDLRQHRHGGVAC